MLTRVVLVLLVALYSVALCRSEEATEVDLGRPDLEEMEKTGAILHNLVTLAQSHADRVGDATHNQGNNEKELPMWLLCVRLCVFVCKKR